MTLCSNEGGVVALKFIYYGQMYNIVVTIQRFQNIS